MIGLDTNVLVRLLVRDDPIQTAQAQRFVASRCTSESPGFINSVVLAELIWVLASIYQYQRSEVAKAIEALLTGEDRVVEHHDEVRASLQAYKSGRVDFTDALIARINRLRGCEATATFDRKAGRFDGFVRIS
jgi:predicted nucleic-acid-binding protein